MNLTEQARQLIELKEAILAELKERDTGRWRWDRIHCCVTGKDADLEPWGQQGIELVSVNATTVTFYVHLGIAYAGTGWGVSARAFVIRSGSPTARTSPSSASFACPKGRRVHGGRSRGGWCSR